MLKDIFDCSDCSDESQDIPRGSSSTAPITSGGPGQKNQNVAASQCRFEAVMTSVELGMSWSNALYGMTSSSYDLAWGRASAKCSLRKCFTRVLRKAMAGLH